MTRRQAIIIICVLMCGLAYLSYMVGKMDGYTQAVIDLRKE